MDWVIVDTLIWAGLIIFFGGVWAVIKVGGGGLDD